MDDWKTLLRSVGPSLATAIGGPLAGAASAFLADKLGLPEKTIDSVTQALTGNNLTPEQITSLKLAEIEFNKFLEANQIKLEEIAAADRNSAREMLKATGSYVPSTLTMIVTIGYFGILIGMMTNTLAVSDSQVMLMMLGQLGTAWGVCLAFWMGTTRNSQEKTNLLANSAPVK